MYTPEYFGRDLKAMVKAKLPHEEIASWASEVLFRHNRDINRDFEEVLERLDMMSFGPEFYFSYEKLERIANDLLAGKDMKCSVNSI